MSDEIDELRSEIAELKSELADIKFSLQNRTFEPLGVSKQNSSFDSMFKNFGQTAGKLFFGNENTMTKGLMSSFNSFTNHYNKITAKNQFSFIGQRFAGGNASSSGSYLVGERGPELFTPHQVGKISSSATENRNIYINLSITTPDVKNFYKSKGKITNDILKNIS